MDAPLAVAAGFPTGYGSAWSYKSLTGPWGGTEPASKGRVGEQRGTPGSQAPRANHGKQGENGDGGSALCQGQRAKLGS